jgi:hypothetical protein
LQILIFEAKSLERIKIFEMYSYRQVIFMTKRRTIQRENDKKTEAHKPDDANGSFSEVNSSQKRANEEYGPEKQKPSSERTKFSQTEANPPMVDSVDWRKRIHEGDREEIIAAIEEAVKHKSTDIISNLLEVISEAGLPYCEYLDVGESIGRTGVNEKQFNELVYAFEFGCPDQSEFCCYTLSVLSDLHLEKHKSRLMKLLPLFIDGLKDLHTSVRLNSAHILGNLGDRDTIPNLTGLVNDENRTVREVAIDSLEKLGVSKQEIEKESVTPRSSEFCDNKSDNRAFRKYEPSQCRCGGTSLAGDDLPIVTNKMFGKDSGFDREAAGRAFEDIEAIVNLKHCWSNLNWDKDEVFHIEDAYELIKGIDYTSKDIIRFCIVMAGLQEEDGFAAKAGIFLSALINKAKEEVHYLPLRHLDTKITSIANHNSKSLLIDDDVEDIAFGMKDGLVTVDGNVGVGAGLSMEGGTLVIKGNAKQTLGESMKGGTIILKGDLIPDDLNRKIAALAYPGRFLEEQTGLAGHCMEGGKLIIEGNASTNVGHRMTGGEIHLEGDFESISDEISGGKIFYKGELLMWVSDDYGKDTKN